MKIVRVVATVAALAGLGAVLNVAVAQGPSRQLAPHLESLAGFLGQQFQISLPDIGPCGNRTPAPELAQFCGTGSIE
jgi:hypothetical protein